MTTSFNFFDQVSLIYRLTKGLEKRGQEVVFLVGAALSAPSTAGAPGVLSSAGLVELIREEFADDLEQQRFLDNDLAAAGQKRYQAAFLFLQGLLGQAAANEIIKKAVMGARRMDASGRENDIDASKATEEELKIVDYDQNWVLNEGTQALARLIVQYPKRFGGTVLTTNFDPLIEVGIRQIGGDYYKTALHNDGNLGQTEARGCHVVHLHGYWHGSDTLHTVAQLQNSRPHLKASLASLLRNKIIVVCGYGGWDDVFTDTLFDVVCDDAANPEILWAFHEGAPHVSDHLRHRISAGLGRGRVLLYAGVDCNELLPRIHETWLTIENPAPSRETGATNQVQVSSALRLKLEASDFQQTRIEGDDEDRPPVVTACVGRESELDLIKHSKSTVVFLTGIGGQGKSTVAAQYYDDTQREGSYKHYVWRDCKEESERFENQLASVVETLSGGRISGQDLSKQDIESIVRLFMALTADTSVLLIFDNADHYISLGSSLMTSSADVLVRAMLSAATESRILLTCRPTVDYHHASALSCRLEGLSLAATRELFTSRGGSCTENEISNAHTATGGHAFWLDLLSMQLATSSSITLTSLLDELGTDGNYVPEKTLNSIWGALSERQRLVLRSMAEAVRPETDSEIADHLHSEMNHRRFLTALESLKSIHLVVVKRRSVADDVFELHPLVRNFIRKRFTMPERTSFIAEIRKAYSRFISSHKYQLTERPTLTILQYWTHTAELDLAGGRINDAILTLVEAGDAFSSSGYSREYCRATRLVLNSFDWVADHGKFKGFDGLLRIHMTNLCNLGEWADAEQLIDKLELSTVERDARFIFFCDLKCFLNWSKGEFAEAVKWGLEGRNLKQNSSVDTQYDVSHNLALAQRDSGRPEEAITVFLRGRSLDEVLDPEELDEDKEGAFYGNIGRCLHFMGQIDPALICYQKSALLIEKNFKGERLINQGYIRRWVGELLLARKENVLAGIFLEAARLKWEQVSPPKAEHIVALQTQFRSRLSDFSKLSKRAIEKKCLDWISGSAYALQ